jgi:hypothetical protein
VKLDIAVVELLHNEISVTNSNADRIGFFGIDLFARVKAVGFTVVTCDNEGLAAEVYVFEAGELAVAGGIGFNGSSFSSSSFRCVFVAAVSGGVRRAVMIGGGVFVAGVAVCGCLSVLLICRGCFTASLLSINKNK